MIGRVRTDPEGCFLCLFHFRRQFGVRWLSWPTGLGWSWELRGSGIIPALTTQGHAGLGLWTPGERVQGQSCPIGLPRAGAVFLLLGP